MGLHCMIAILHARILWNCCGGGKHKTASQKYSTLKKAGIFNIVRSLGEAIIVLVTVTIAKSVIGGDDSLNTTIIAYSVCVWALRVYALLAAYELAPPRPPAIPQQPLVVNVFQPVKA